MPGRKAAGRARVTGALDDLSWVDGRLGVVFGAARGLVVGALLLALAAAASAHRADDGAPPEDRTRVTIPEPRRRTPVEKVPLLVSVTYGEAEAGVDRFPQALPKLVRFIQEKTEAGLLLRTLEATLGDPRANGAALLYLTGHNAALRFTEVQRRWLGQYLRSGGLLYAEDVVAQISHRSYVLGAGQAGTIFDTQVRQLMQDPAVLGQAGRDWRRPPDDHPLFSSFFSFPTPPPPAGSDPGATTYLEMLEWRGRTVVLLSELNISWSWVSGESPGRVRGLQFGTNLVVYALANQSAGPALRTRP